MVCCRWFEHEGNLKQHIIRAHQDGLGHELIYHKPLFPVDGLDSKFRPICLFCRDKFDHLERDQDWPELAFHYLNEHSDKLNIIGFQRDWLARDVCIELARRGDFESERH